MDVAITRAAMSDLDAVEALYNDVCDYLTDKEYNPGWRKGYFPTRENAVCFIETLQMAERQLSGHKTNSNLQIEREKNFETFRTRFFYVRCPGTCPKTDWEGAGA